MLNMGEKCWKEVTQMKKTQATQKAVERKPILLKPDSCFLASIVIKKEKE